MSKHGEEDRYRIDFTPSSVGSHVISGNYGGQTIPGSPYTCHVYDAETVRLLDISQTGVIGNEMGFTGELNSHLIFDICESFLTS